MAINQQFKITKLAKDLGMKSKDLVEILAQNGIEAKTTQKALEPVEFDLLFEQLTKENQIVNIGDYLDGVSYIPSKIKKTEKPKAEEAPKAEEKKAEPAPAPVAEKKVAPAAPASDKKAEKPAAPVAEKKEAPAAPAAEKKAEKPAAPVAEKKAEPAPAPVAEKKAETPAAPARPQARQPYAGNPYRPQQNGLSQNQNQAAPGAAGRASAPASEPAASDDDPYKEIFKIFNK